MIKNLLRKKWVKFILIIHAMALVGLIVLSFFISHISHQEFTKASHSAPFDVIIVPGYPFVKEEWSDIMKIRVHWSKYLFQNGFTKNIIYSGSAVYTPYIESVIMKSYGEKLGLPSVNLFEEKQAEHSSENLYYSIKLAKEQGFQRIALATDPIQSFFLMRFAENQSYKIDFLPVQYNLMNKESLTSPKIDSDEAFVHDFVSLPDRQGYIERFRGTLGEYVKDLEL